jgi:hypothetical protein
LGSQKNKGTQRSASEDSSRNPRRGNLGINEESDMGTP